MKYLLLALLLFSALPSVCQSPASGNVRRAAGEFFTVQTKIADLWFESSDDSSKLITFFLYIQKDSKLPLTASENVHLTLDQENVCGKPKQKEYSFLLSEMDWYAVADTSGLLLGKTLGDISFVGKGNTFRAQLLFKQLFKGEPPMIFKKMDVDYVREIKAEMLYEVAD